VKLTDLSIKALTAPERGQKTYFDDSLSGFGVRLSSGGVKSFVLVHGRSRSRTTIGRYPIISLADARTEAKRVLAERILGKHQTPSLLFHQGLTLFLETHCDRKNRPRTKKETKRLLERHFLPSLRHERLSEITTGQISKVIDRLLDTPAEANHAFSAIRLFFRWATRRRYVIHSPVEGLVMPAPVSSRDRVLTGKELVQVYRHTFAPNPLGPIIRLLILTGQRSSEIANLRSSFIDQEQKTITLPSWLTKNHREHAFPLGADAASILAEITPEESGLYFSARGKPDQPFNGWSKCKQEFDRECPIAHWTLHDLRRTFATHLASLDVAPHVVERLLNHSSGTIKGVAAIYNRYRYMDEMRSALGLWEGHMQSLVAAAGDERQRASA
jgi:integrase